MQLEFVRHIFEKVSSVSSHENPSNGSSVVPCGRTDGHDEANSGLLQFCESASYLYSISCIIWRFYSHSCFIIANRLPVL